MTEPVPPVSSVAVRRPLRDSALFRLTVIGVLVLALLIPLAMIRGLVFERAARQGEAATEIAGTWGGGQTLAGPVLVVPYQTHVVNERKEILRTDTSYLYVLPETLAVDGRLLPEVRSRGLYDVVVYRAELAVAGSFARPDLAAFRIPAADVLWDDAFVTVGVPDLRGVRDEVRLRWRGREVAFEPGGGENALWSSALRAPVPGLAGVAPGGSLPFAFDLGIQGSGRFRVVPAGKRTRLALRSAWADPSFSGAFLPERRQVSPGGFQASWSVTYFGRGYSQQFRAAGGEDLVGPRAGMEASALGVDLVLPADAYQKTERSLKYGVLFLLLTFVTFFLMELFHPVSLHPVQYLLVGAALCLFYLLLLSVSEQLGFGPAYAIAAAATVALIGGYSLAILKGRSAGLPDGSHKTRALVLAAVLGVLYGYLYVLLQAEDYALLLGAVGLFVILALVMFLTRRIDWSSRRGEPAPGLTVRG